MTVTITITSTITLTSTLTITSTIIGQRDVRPTVINYGVQLLIAHAQGCQSLTRQTMAIKIDDVFVTTDDVMITDDIVSPMSRSQSGGYFWHSLRLSVPLVLNIICLCYCIISFCVFSIKTQCHRNTTRAVTCILSYHSIWELEATN